MAKSVRMIPATKKIHTGMPLDALSKRRVAAYARVSTDSDEQFTSYEAQIDYYTRMIKKRSDWEFVDVYTDEGITGTNTKHRDGFNRMVRDALAGKIDLIVTKSVSRFARNTVDSLTTVRKLKQAGVEVFFEKENIYTLDSKGELLITIMSSLAQEESRSISENVTWGKRKRLSDGVVQMPYRSFLGYEKGPDGTPAIVDDEAEIVRTIYDMFLMGSSVRAIADHLTSERIPTPRGKDVWSTGTVYSILRNEKYKGAALLQKTFTTDFLTKKYKINEGEVPQYYVEDSHPAIIDPHLWDITQLELARRNSLGRHYSGCGLFSGRVFCSECGSLYGPRKWKTKAEGERIAWRCANRYRNKKDCESPIVTEDALKGKFVEAFNEIYDDRDLVIECCRTLLDKYLDTADLDSEIDEAINRCEVIKGLNEKLIDENASQPMDQDAFQKKYDSYVAEYEKERQHVEELKRAKSEKNGKANQISAFMFEIHERESVIEDFDERLWITSIEKVTVNHDGSMVFSFKNGMEVTK